MISVFADEVKEYTIEVNPESLDEEKILLFKEYGINRISIGVQSSNDRILSSLNRKHSFADVKDKIALLKKHDLNNISVDLMYSLPDQTMEILDQSIEDILSLDVPHISLYSLTIEENSVFGKKGISNLDEESEADMYEFIEKKLTENGYIHYEVSNYCKKGYESKHNLGYWNYEDFVGVSLGASGKIGNHRYTNTRDFKKYFTLKDYRDEDLYLEKEEMEFEHIMMSLRTIYGLNIQKFNALYGCDLQKKYKKGIASDHIEIKDGHLICTDLEILDTVLLDFMLYR
jgi:oxygen-independent coproporphyrinogen-3 oxidase